VCDSDPLVLFAHTLPPIDCCSSLLALLVCALSQESENTALTVAAYKGHDEVVRLLLQRGAKIDHQVSTVELSCIISVASSLLFCSSVLCFDERPAMQSSHFLYQPETCLPFVCVQDKYGQTALYSSSANNRIKVVKALLVNAYVAIRVYHLLVALGQLGSFQARPVVASLIVWLTVVGPQGQYGTARQGLSAGHDSRNGVLPEWRLACFP